MAQFHVYRIVGNRLVLDLQTDLIDTGTRVVAPLFPVSTGPRGISRLEPLVDVEGERYVLHTAEMAAIPKSVLQGKPVADLSDRDHEIRGALDMVFSGF